MTGHPPSTRLIGLLAGARRETRLTRKNVADRIGVSPAAVSQWEAGQSRPSIDTLIRWAHAVHCEVTVVAAPEIAGWAYAIPAGLRDAACELFTGELP